jgi:hypothetical protein
VLDSGDLSRFEQSGQPPGCCLASFPDAPAAFSAWIDSE